MYVEHNLVYERKIYDYIAHKLQLTRNIYYSKWICIKGKLLLHYYLSEINVRFYTKMLPYNYAFGPYMGLCKTKVRHSG